MLFSKWLLIFEKILLGVTLAAPIGPVSVEMIKRGLQRGFWSAFSVRLGGAVGNTLCLIGTYLGLSYLMAKPMVINILGLLGSLLLLYMGISTLRKNIAAVNIDDGNISYNGIKLGLYLAIMNPVALVFWPGIFAVSINPQQLIDVHNISIFLLNLFIIIGVLIWGAGLSLVLAFFGRVLNKSIIGVLTKIAGLLMIFYGCKYAYCVYMRFL